MCPEGIGETLASRKVVYCEVSTEVSGTARVCTDEQEVHKRHNALDEIAQHIEVPRIRTVRYVDATGIDSKGICLTGGGLLID